ncbi:MAG: type III-B CRISPR module RAMP protein Cmr6, partial [Minisyncoccia bacterium]
MSVIKIPNNEFFNKDFNQVRNRFFGSQIEDQKFKEINFFYLFNLPNIIRRNNEISSIKINDNLEKFRWHIDFIKSIKERRNKMLSLFSENGYELSNIPPLTLSWRLVIGLGASHPQETSMTLHHIYGIPYIPGSAVKGVTKHWAVLRLAEEYVKKGKNIEEAIEAVSKALEEGKELEELKEINLNPEITFQDSIKIFGTQKEEGKVIFFDAYPDESIELKIDIMNPHYP